MRISDWISDVCSSDRARIRAGHGRAVLWDGHSIRGELPFLFDGRLPDMNLGTANGASCSPPLQSRLEQVLASQDDYGFAANVRSEGGHINTRSAYPAHTTAAVQRETTQRLPYASAY